MMSLATYIIKFFILYQFDKWNIIPHFALLSIFQSMRDYKSYIYTLRIVDALAISLHGIVVVFFLIYKISLHALAIVIWVAVLVIWICLHFPLLPR